MVALIAGMYRYFPGEIDLVTMHNLGSGFRVDFDDDRSFPALEALRRARAWERIDAALHTALAVRLDTTPASACPTSRW